MAAKVGTTAKGGTPAGGTSSTSTGATPAAGSAGGGAPTKQGQPATTTPAGNRGSGSSRPAVPPRAPSGGGTTGAKLAGTANFGAGFILGLVLWVWVGMPFLKGGPGAVRDQLRAKFFNKDAKGNWLP